MDVSSSNAAIVTAAPSALTFTRSTWSTAQTVTVSPTGASRTTLTNTAAGGDYAALDTAVAVTVLPALSIDAPSMTEGDNGSVDLEFTVRLSAASSRDVTVEYADAGTATAGTDYTALTSGTLTFTAGTTSRTVTVSVTGDTTDEPHETVVVKLRNATNVTISTATGTGTITDADDTPTVTLSLAPASIAESGAAHVSTVTANLDRPSSAVTTVTVFAAAGTHAAAGDFTLSDPATLTIAAGATASTGTVTVTANDNSADEPDKRVTVSGTAANSQGITNPADVTLTITDDDAAPTVTLAAAPASIAENQGTATVTATLSHASSVATTVTVRAVSDLYTVGADTTIVIAAGSTANAADTVTITAVDDAIDNLTARSGTVTATAANSQGIGTLRGADLILTDDEGTPTATVKLTPASVVENGGPATVTANLSGASSAAVTLTVSATAGPHAEVGDFRLSSARTLTFAAGATASTGTVTLTAVDDARDGPNKAVTVAATVTGGSGITAPGSRTLTIVDDDGAPSLSIDAPRVTEGDSGATTLTFAVRLSPASGQQVTVEYTNAGTGTATEGTDYTAIPGGTLTFGAGETHKTIGVAVTGDTEAEGDETVVVTLRNPTNAVLGTATGTGTIADDDVRPPVSNDEGPRPERDGQDDGGNPDGGEPPAVPADLEPSFEARTVEGRVWRQDREIAAFTLPAATGGDPPVRYALRPDLPAGVTRVAFRVGGTPTAPMEATPYTWTATDADGDAAELTFTLAVAEDRKPTFAETVPPQRYWVGTAVAPLTLPAATGGDAPLTYTLTPPPPRARCPARRPRPRTMAGVR